MKMKASRLLAAALPAAGAVGAALVCTVLLITLADSYARGLTWSGLNPGGGGPGFLLLLAAAGSALVSRPRWVRRLRPTYATFEAALTAGLAGTVLFGLMQTVLRDNAPSTAPVVSGVVGAFFVPRIVLAVLRHAWLEAEQQPAPTESTNPIGQSATPCKGGFDANA